MGRPVACFIFTLLIVNILASSSYVKMSADQKGGNGFLGRSPNELLVKEDKKETDDRIIFPDSIPDAKTKNEVKVKEQNSEQPEKVTPSFGSRSIIGAPVRCPPGYKPTPSGVCRKIL